MSWNLLDLSGSLLNRLALLVRRDLLVNYLLLGSSLSGSLLGRSLLNNTLLGLLSNLLTGSLLSLETGRKVFLGKSVVVRIHRNIGVVR